MSDSRAAFAKALEERGLYLAKGDRRAHVALTFEGATISIPKALGKKTKEVTARLGAADGLVILDRVFNVFKNRPWPSSKTPPPAKEVGWLKVYEEKFGPCEEEAPETDNVIKFDPKRFH